MDDKFSMTNKELSDCIMQTNEMIKTCAQAAIRMKYLNDHFKKLLDIQEARANLIKLNIQQEVKP